jgi:succinyldiaminopimelate transaminase
LRETVAQWFARRRGVPDLDPDGVLPTIGSKEMVAWLPTLLGLRDGDVVVHPEVAYPTYDVGARLAGATPLPADGTLQVGPATGRVRLVFVNSPGNPTGKVLGVEHLRKMVGWARSIGAVLVSDECYAELGWDGVRVPSLLDPEVCDGSPEGLLVLYSTSKQSNLAGYRAAFAAGDPVLVRRVLEIRKHAGMIVPWPIQEALRVALADDGHVAEQRARYAARREIAAAALVRSGFRIDHSQAGLYLWATRQEGCWDTVSALADRGVLVAPGEFYGAAGAAHVRVALTATDERIGQLADRLSDFER